MGIFSLNVEIKYLEKLKLHYLEISTEVLTQLNDNNEKGKFNQRVIINVNEKIKWQAGIVALGEGKGYITISKARMKSLNVHLGNTVLFTLEKNTSELGLDFPLELEEVLRQDAEANIRFNALTLGKQRTIIYYILQVKNSNKRIELSLQFMFNLKKCPIGKVTMPILFGKE